MGENGHFLDVLEYGAGLDWLTYSSPTDAEGIRSFCKFGRHMMQSYEGIEGNRTQQKIGAYNGYRVGDISFVQRAYDKHCMLVATGKVAEKLAMEVITHNVAGKPTRIDAQTTSRAIRPNPEYIEQCRQYAIATRGQKGAGRRKGISLFDSASGSTGLAVNSRSSAKYGRSYDHEAKHNSYKGFRLWRHEVELKEQAALHFWEMYRDHDKKSSLCAAVVKDFFEDARIMLPWLGDVDALKVIATKETSDADKRLEYFRRVVAPMMFKMQQEGNLGAMQEILAGQRLVLLDAP